MENLPVTLKQAQSMLPSLIKANVVPFLHGSPAIGKSSVVKAIAEKFKLKLIDVRLSQLDPTDLVGFPTFDQEKVVYKPVDLFPLETDEVPKGYNGWLLFLDEANGASHAVQMASYRLILDREVGNHKLHKQVAIVAAGNLETDGAIVNTMSSALISRFAHFNIKLNRDDWLEWAANAGVDYRITSFLAFKGDLLYTFKPDATDPYAAPRTWDMVSRVIKGETIVQEHMPLIASMIGEGTAREFITYTNLYDKLTSFDQIIADPTGVPLPEELATQWACMSMVCTEVTDKTATQVATYLSRLKMELQVCAMREIKNRKGLEFVKKEMREWFSATAKEIF